MSEVQDTTPPLEHPGWDKLLDAAEKHRPSRWRRFKRNMHFVAQLIRAALRVRP